MLDPDEPQDTPDWQLPSRDLLYPTGYAGDDELDLPALVELGEN